MKVKQIAALFLCLVLLLAGGEVILSAFALRANAADTYSSPLQDLGQTENFNTADYPENPTDYSLQVIALAESTDGELYVYVYQPSKSKVTVDSIFLSTAYRTKKDFKEYGLSLVSSTGVFYKYRVEDIEILNVNVRYYEISDIHRKWDAAYDEEPGAGNSASTVTYPVGKQYSFTTDSTGKVTTAVHDIEYVQILNKFVGFVRYDNHTFNWFMQHDDCDAHFVAFSTDKKMDKLLEADLYYVEQKYSLKTVYGSINETYGEKEDKYVYIDYLQKGYTVTGGTFTKNEATWNRIQKTSDFLAQDFDVGVFAFSGFDGKSGIAFTEEAYDALSKTEWVMSFVETPNTMESGYETFTKTYSIVGDVKIMRLKFETDGVIYDLGVVDNKQTGSLTPAGSVGGDDLLTMIFALLLLVVVLILVWPFVSPLFILFLQFIGTGAKFLLSYFVKFLWWLLGLPFRLLSSLLGGRK